MSQSCAKNEFPTGDEPPCIACPISKVGCDSFKQFMDIAYENCLRDCGFLQTRSPGSSFDKLEFVEIAAPVFGVVFILLLIKLVVLPRYSRYRARRQSLHAANIDEMERGEAPPGQIEVEPAAAGTSGDNNTLGECPQSLGKTEDISDQEELLKHVESE
ncbi:uncharacterized protein LOC114520434 [Dendronephthya gigantea]|uniref:uncharacterized protein LOC114520434 n=1 Tax=Dendronephthya gigantea TaxID=151771 RepID=UPI00106AC669|nr:uncharacterized protein LOC114520434 [Dendronephthya gigantea]